jgi:leucine-rich repeat protein SHOC2
VTEVELAAIIEKARVEEFEKLYINNEQLTSLPESIGDLPSMYLLDIQGNMLTTLPENIGNLSKLNYLNLCENNLTDLPDNFGNLSNLTELRLSSNQLCHLPKNFGNLINLEKLVLCDNQLSALPENIGNFTKLTALYLDDNLLDRLPETIGNLVNLYALYLSSNRIHALPVSINKLCQLTYIDLDDNIDLQDLSLLSSLPKLTHVLFRGVYLPRRYWNKLSDWTPKWLLDEDNAEVRRVLIQQIGSDRICQELGAIDLGTWREYTLLKIDADIDEEPMVLLKMTCPSTGHIHILRVPPEVTSAEAAITWVNHGIHPDEFAIQK